MVNLTDNDGNIITSNEDHWYKIALADGSELGLGNERPSPAQNGRTQIKVVPAGRGMIFRYQRQDGDNRAHQGWPIGDKGYLRGLQVMADGTHIVKNMSLSGVPVQLNMYDDNDNWGMLAEQLPKHRVALYGYLKNNKLCGIRVAPDGSLIAHESPYAMALDCEFVKVSTPRFKGLF